MTRFWKTREPTRLAQGSAAVPATWKEPREPGRPAPSFAQAASSAASEPTKSPRRPGEGRSE